ncbi:MAG: hypothetical protein MI785_15000 [Kiloniellales bacterium]|nr:hypothetical protein [Kiloniellales bacterium]
MAKPQPTSETTDLAARHRHTDIRQDLHDTALHCLIVQGCCRRSDFYRFGFTHQDILAHGLQALVTARLDHACRRAGAAS